MFNYSATVVRVVDGDTIVFQFDLGFHIYHTARVRLLGVNCPERGKPGGSEATAFVNGICPPGTLCTVTTTKDSTDKYGRYIADVGDIPGVGNLRAFLIANGHGVPQEMT